MFIFRSSGGPHDPVRHRAHAQTRARTYSFTSVRTQGGLRISATHARAHASSLSFTHTHTGRSCAFPSLSESCASSSARPSVSARLSVGPARHSWGGLRMWGAGAFRCSSTGSTSQLPHCSSSPPSGKLIRSRVPGPSAGTRLISSLHSAFII